MKTLCSVSRVRSPASSSLSVVGIAGIQDSQPVSLSSELQGYLLQDVPGGGLLCNLEGLAQGLDLHVLWVFPRASFHCIPSPPQQKSLLTEAHCSRVFMQSNSPLELPLLSCLRA